MQVSNATFYIARHGETAWNKDHKIQGHRDIDLTEKGRQQAEELSKKLPDYFEACFSSDLSRANETARIVAKNSFVVQDSRLRERDFKQWEGKSIHEYLKAPSH